ncbi:MAG TPA: universal stress protein [Candidatus Binataceae bacterium]|nr:universal stress protein [Candidatus Binataceae bacterium]
MAFPYKLILCPVAFDENSLRVLREAAAIARAFGGKIVVLHVVWINPLSTEGFVFAELRDSQTKAALDKLTQFVAGELSGVDHQLAVEVGEAGDTILDLAKDLKPDLIVMATHGRHGVKHLMLGSVAERIVRSADAPVLTIHPHIPS